MTYLEQHQPALVVEILDFAAAIERERQRARTARALLAYNWPDGYPIDKPEDA